MSRVDPPPLDHHGNPIQAPEGIDAVTGQEVMDLDVFELSGEKTQRLDDSWSQDGDLQGSGQLETKWILWHEFMKEHAHLDTWLQLTEQAVGLPNSAHVTYITAKEELRKFERLRCEAGHRLVQLDGLTQRNRKLTRLFQGTMQARLLAAARECGARWDDVNAKLESITGQLKLFVSEWEEFEAERAELALWLADLDVRLTEVDYLTGNTCEKLRRLQSFQQCVCVNSDRVNALLQRGEALIQRSEPSDIQQLENHLLELLRCCSRIYNNIARTHTRLLSMRLVFEDDWILSQATDSGCPSESLLEDEGAFDKPNLDVPLTSDHSTDEPDFSQSAHTFPSHSTSPLLLPPPPPASPFSPSHEHLGLEWDPSVDIGRSISRDDADSSYFSIATGLCHREGTLKRRSFLSFSGSRSDISNDIINQESEPLSRDQWTTSTPDRRGFEPISFDGGRVQAWLGVQSSAPLDKKASCCKAMQTDREMQFYLDEPHVFDSQHHYDNALKPFLGPSRSPSHDLKGAPDWMRHQYQSNIHAEEEPPCCEEVERPVSQQSGTSSGSRASSSLLPPVLLYLLLAAAVALLACLMWAFLEPPCQQSSSLPRSLNLVLRYVNGPPPT